mgnify:CR=1 FL=1
MRRGASRFPAAAGATGNVAVVSSTDAPQMIEQAVRTVLEEVPALKPLKLVVGIDLRGRGDIQQFRLQMPEVKVTKDLAADARIRVEMRRDFFNEMVRQGARTADWERAFAEGRARASGIEEYIKLIARVVEKQRERSRLPRARG